MGAAGGATDRRGRRRKTYSRLKIRATLTNRTGLADLYAVKKIAVPIAAVWRYREAWPLGEPGDESKAFRRGRSVGTVRPARIGGFLYP
jgi:hypothetical protein